jgi:hypothetical protein
MRVSVADRGLTFSTDHDVSLPWASLLFVTENKTAYFARFKNYVVRLPKREFTPEQISTFKEIVRRNVPESAVRTLSP